jgi:predicted kinase
MPTLTITRGLPGSGKTTWAHAQQELDPTIVLAGRDHIRRMVGPVPWPHGDEKAEHRCTVIQYAVIRTALAEGLSVIADDTCLSWRNAHQLAAVALSVGLGIEIHIEDFTRVPLEVCIAQDAARPAAEQVGKETIRAMAARWLTPGSEEKK